MQQDHGMQHVDVAVIGAGFSGLYLLHRLRLAGFNAVCLEVADDVGGTWYWNRYPGARCDGQTFDYQFTFDPELRKAWKWSEKYATQPEILRYLGFIADRYDLRRDIRFETKLTAASWNENSERWILRTDAGPSVSCRYYIMATGCLSAPKPPEIPGAESFEGQILITGQWPHEDVDLTGRRVAVIGTGSSGIQLIPIVAEQAAELTVFQRTPNFAFPAHNGPVVSKRLEWLERDPEGYRSAARSSSSGVPTSRASRMSWEMTDAERRERFEAAWNEGELVAMLTELWSDQGYDLEANKLVQDLIREKIRSRVTNPEIAELLSPHDHPMGSKRPCLETNYFETYNRSNVKLVNLREEPIVSIGPGEINTRSRSVAVDTIIFATGFDAMTGALLSINPLVGRGGKTLSEVWADGPKSYLGLTVAGFPNFFMITGPGSPSVLSTMAVSIEQHVDWVVGRLTEMRSSGFTTIEPTETAQAGWQRHLSDCNQLSLHRLANTWYTGANVEGKPQVVMPYTGGVGSYRQICDEVVETGMLGFRLTGPTRAPQCNDGEIVRVQPDVRLVLKRFSKMNIPPLESLGATGARVLLEQLNQARPPGRPVGEVVDGVLPLPSSGEFLPYRLYRPSSAGPHRVVVYYHGGGWVVGDERSDDAFCRDLCRRSDMIFVSIGYRHAPECRFPTAAEDAYAAALWVAENASVLGGRSEPILVAGWSAGGNLAAVTCQLARDRGGPVIGGQLLVCPVTDCDFTRPSYTENAEGYFLTRGAMHWFWDLYCSPDDRTDPRASPARGRLEGLPPALVVTAEFDPLRDDGMAYAEALAAAGVAVKQLNGRGHFHSSYTMVDVVLTGEPGRQWMAAGLCEMAGLSDVGKQADADVMAAAE